MKVRKFTYILAAGTILLGGLVLAKGEEFVNGFYNYFDHFLNPTKIEKKVEEVNQESALETKLKSFSGFEHVDQYDNMIIKHTNFWNDEFKHHKGYQRLDANLVKSMIVQESGGHRDAFEHDPMQIANAGDYALRVLQNGSETGVPKYGELRGIRQTKRKNGAWDYSASNMTANLSVKYGTRWLIHKACKFNGNGEVVGFRPWEKALERYNGSSHKKQYANSIVARLR